MKGYLVQGLCLLFLLLIGCSPYGTEDVSFGYKCNDVGRLAMFRETGVDEAILESCKEICISNLMTYSGSYKCDPTTRDLSCVCSVTPERIEQREIIADSLIKKKTDQACIIKCESEQWGFRDSAPYKQGEDTFYCLCYRGSADRMMAVNVTDIDRIMRSGSKR